MTILRKPVSLRYWRSSDCCYHLRLRLYAAQSFWLRRLFWRLISLSEYIWGLGRLWQNKAAKQWSPSRPLGRCNDFASSSPLKSQQSGRFHSKNHLRYCAEKLAVFQLAAGAAASFNRPPSRKVRSETSYRSLLSLSSSSSRPFPMCKCFRP